MTSENQFVQQKLIPEIKARGWKLIEARELKNNLIKEIFVKKIKEINKELFEHYQDKEKEIFDLITTKLQSSDARKILTFLKYGIPIAIKKNVSIPLTIKLIDYNNITHNDFSFTNEQEFYGLNKRRADLMLFINGIPIVIVEAKDPFKARVDALNEAINDIKFYSQKAPELFKFLQIGIAAADKIVYLGVWPNMHTIKYHIWRKSDYKEECFSEILQPNILLEIIQFFIFFKTTSNDVEKIVPRYMQYYATKKAIKRIKDYLNEKTKLNKGLVWHWQGSGKTYTMYFIGNYFYHLYQNKNPIIFFNIDRNELQDQIKEKHLGPIENQRIKELKIINTKKELKELINNIKENKTWGMFILTIQKLTPKDFEEFINNPVNKKEILFLIDEAHRTQYGELAATRKAIFPNAVAIGFTGTPLIKSDKNTFFEFSNVTSGELALDVYFITQSERDGFTLPIIYRKIKEQNLDILLKEEDIKLLLESFIKDDITAEEILNGRYAKEIKNKISKNLNKIKVFLEGKKRIHSVVKYIKEHIKEDTEDFKFKAMVVAATRKACVIYKQFFDQYFDEDETAVVMTYENKEDDKIIGDFLEKQLKKYKVQDWHELNNNFKNDFLNKENPKILIVTDMLLTGFDAPILKVMYLDKFLRFHKLLQAIARTNRPLIAKDKKFGLIIDTIGLLGHIKHTLATYNFLAENNPDEIRKTFEDVIRDVNQELAILEKNVNDIKEILNKQGIDVDSALKSMASSFEVKEEIDLKISEWMLKDETSFKAFYELLKDTLKLYNALGSEPRKLKYKSYYEFFVIIYFIIKRKLKINLKQSLSKAFWKELLKEVANQTVIDKVISIFEKEISVYEKIRLQFKNVSDYIHVLRNTIQDRLYNPLYREIYLKLEKLKEDWIKRHDESIFEEVKQLKKEVDELIKIENYEITKKIIITLKKILKQKKILEKFSKTLKENLIRILENPIRHKKLLPLDEKRIKTLIMKEVIKNNGNLEELMHVLDLMVEYIKREIEK